MEVLDGKVQKYVRRLKDEENGGFKKEKLAGNAGKTFIKF